MPTFENRMAGGIASCRMERSWTPSQPLPVHSINHITFVVKNVAASLAFYETLLGFVQIQRPDSFHFYGAWMWREGMAIHLIEGEPVRRSAIIDPMADHLSFVASAAFSEVERCLNSHGVRYVKQRVFENGMEVDQLFFHDPDMFMIEICNCDCIPVRRIGSDRGSFEAASDASSGGRLSPAVSFQKGNGSGHAAQRMDTDMWEK